MRVVLSLFILSILISCSTMQNKKCTACSVVSKTSDLSKPMKFDYILDEYVDGNDPRVKSLILVAKEYKSSKIEIYYQNVGGGALAKRLYSLLSISINNQILQPNLSNSMTDDKHVFVYIRYRAK